MTSQMNDKDWELLLGRIKDGKCTPFLGAGACFGALPLGAEIARKWAKEYNYPFENSDDLAEVAQFLAVQYDHMYPKEQIIRQFFSNPKPPDFLAPSEPHSTLAELPLPVFMTTNYDSFMMQALESKNKKPRRELCRWNKYIRGNTSQESVGEPDPLNPLVFHLHGHDREAESLVLTHDDYLAFLVNVSRDSNLLPPRIQRALAGTSLLFIGYSLEDWSFKVLFRGIVESTEEALRRISVTVQLPRNETEQEYLELYFSGWDMRVFWGTAQEFAAELGRRWKEFSNGG